MYPALDFNVLTVQTLSGEHTGLQRIHSVASFSIHTNCRCHLLTLCFKHLFDQFGDFSHLTGFYVGRGKVSILEKNQPHFKMSLRSQGFKSAEPCKVCSTWSSIWNSQNFFGANVSDEEGVAHVCFPRNKNTWYKLIVYKFLTRCQFMEPKHWGLNSSKRYILTFTLNIEFKHVWRTASENRLEKESQ